MAFYKLFFDSTLLSPPYTHQHVVITDAVSCNSVSDSVASEMALGVCKSFMTDWGIGVTGYSSPLPGHDMNPLYAHFAIYFKNEILKSGKLTSEIKEPLQVQLNYVNDILIAFLDVVNGIAKI